MSTRERLAVVARTVGTLALLQAALPANLALTAAALVRRRLVGHDADPFPEPSIKRRTVLLSGGKMTKALTLARAFHAAGHRVVLVESARYRLTGHRWSRAVDAFHTIPPPQSPDYIAALVDIVRREGVDVYVPVCSPASSRYDALAKPELSRWCEVLHGDADDIDRVDDKFAFASAAGSLDLPVPETRRITEPEEVVAELDGRDGAFILKSIAYDPVQRLDLTRLPRPTPQETDAFARSKPISEKRPWILQAFVPGREYCTHGTARSGRLQVWACCASSASQLNYEMVAHPRIEEWVRTFVADLGLTGQYSFDFIETDSGEVQAIECNPRTHSAITMFYDHPDLARAYLDEDVATIRPTATSRPTYWLYNELWKGLRHPETIVERVEVVRRGKDAIFDWDDPLPFLLVHHVQVPWLLAVNLIHLRPWVKIDFNIGKLVEPAGD